MQIAQIALNQLAISVCKYSMYFVPSKCKVPLQDCEEPVPALTLTGEPLEVVDKFEYLGSYMSAGGGVTDEISNRMMKTRAAYINFNRHIWRRREVSLAPCGIRHLTVSPVICLINNSGLPLIFAQSSNQPNSSLSSPSPSSSSSSSSVFSSFSTAQASVLAAGQYAEHEEACVLMPLLFSFANKSEGYLLRVRIGKG
ncbi:unnamed protein product [Trichobilharzia regenti]|nr:unnamed protein product [Trichobilharzia regenti]